MERIIAIENTGFTSLGTGTAKTLLGGANVILPAWAKSILAVIPSVVIDVQTAGESVLTSCEVESDDVAINPFQVFPAPIGAALGATASTFVPRPEKYAIGCPVNGGEQIRTYETALVANTAAPTGSAGIVISNQPAGHLQRHAKIGTLTSSGTTATSDVAGTRYNFSGAQHIIELMGIFGHGIVAAASAVNGYFKFTSNEFVQAVPLKLSMTPVGSGLSTLIPTAIDGVSRAVVDVPVSNGQVNILDYLYMGLAPTAAGNFCTGVIYE